MKKAILAAAVLTAAIGAQAAAPNLVTNGSFESGDFGLGSFDGWLTTFGDPNTFVDSSGQTGSAYGQASDGLWAAYFGSLVSTGGATISQTLATVAGRTYELSFDLANDDAGIAPANGFFGSIDGTTLFDMTGLPAQGYVHEHYTFVADGPGTTLLLGGYNDASYVELDNVSVMAVPEPATAWLSGIGALMLGLALRRRDTER